MTLGTSSDTSVWAFMRSALEDRGFEQYRKSSVGDEEDETQERKSEVITGPLTIIQLVRSMAGIPMSMIDYPTFAFWNSADLATYLNSIWSPLESALKLIDPNSHSIVSWGSYPPARDVLELLEIVKRASQIEPDLPVQHFTARPRSSFLVRPKSVESVIFNTIGVVRTHKDLSYGDLLSSLLTPRCANEELLRRLDEQIPEHLRLLVQADRETPIPALLSRIYVQIDDDQLRDSRSLSVQDFFRVLEAQNNLSGLSDQALSARLLSMLKPSGKDKKPQLPSGLQKLVDSQSTSASN
jgi:hypothetical protein